MRAPSVTFWRTRPGLEISRVEASAHVFPAHFHDEMYSITIMHAGASLCLGPGQGERTLRAGQACLINPGQIHCCVPVRKTAVTYSMIHILADTLRELALDLPGAQKNGPSRSRSVWPEFTTTICTRPDLIAVLERLVLVQSEPRGELERESALVRAMGDVLRAHGGLVEANHGLQPLAVRRAKDILSSGLERKLTLQELADAVGLSRYHLLRQFKRQTGVPPHVFRTQLRVDQARILLRQGMPLAEVAQATGFTDQAHFTNTFKLYTGATPGQYANRRHADFRHGDAA